MMHSKTSYVDLCGSDANVDRTPFLILQPVSYLTRTISSRGEAHLVSGYLGETPLLHIRAGLPDEPPCTIALCYDVEHAITYLSDARAKRPELPLWYDGLEMRCEIEGDPRRWLEDLLNAPPAEDDQTLDDE